MTELPPDLRSLATHLAGGPAFLLLGEQGPKRLGQVAKAYRWSGVYTSATDAAAAQAFVDESRTITSLGAMGRAPSRSQSALEIRYLFGGLHLPDSEQPPTDPMGRARALQRSNRELDRLVTETVTPRGTLIVEAWEPSDALSVSDLASALSLLGAHQAHLFSAAPWRGDPLITSIASSGQLVLHESTLEEALNALQEAGASGKPRSGSSNLSQHVIPLGSGFVDIDIHTWNQIRRSARPVDLDLLVPPVFSSDAARYQEFRNFIGATEGVPPWRGIAAGMHIRREFESTLGEAIREELRDKDLLAPIVVAGQTATGKSVALAALAMELAQSGDVAVLHQSRRTVRPAVEDIDLFSAWAESQGAKATVLVWDAMVDPTEYTVFSRQLQARGRKVLVVGSAYLNPGTEARITAPAELSRLETDQLFGLLHEFGVDLKLPHGILDSTFLAFLYRTLPETEYQLRSGLASEMRAAERGMARLARRLGNETTGESRLTAMQAALAAAGLNLQDLLPRDGTHEGDGAEESVEQRGFLERAPIQRVTGLVLVAGRHGLPVPIDLALRILGREGFLSLRQALASSDIIREIDDDNGDYYLSARSHLEAELLAQHEIPLPVEVEVISEVIKNIRSSDGFSGGPDEVDFAVKLLERIGPASSRASMYEQYFGQIAAALRERRLEAGRINTRLALQESYFARQFVQWEQKVGHGGIDARIAELEYNRELLEEALAEKQEARGLIRLSLSVELAATLGAIIHEFTKSSLGIPIQGIGSRMDDVLRAAMDARSVDPGNVHAVDVLAWSTRDAVNSGVLAPAERVDRIATALAVIGSLDRMLLSERQLAVLDERARTLNQLLGRDAEAWEYLRRLERNSDPAAAFFLAQFSAENGPRGEAEALEFLRSSPSETRTDWRCAQLLIDLTWKHVAGGRLLSGERIPLHLSTEALKQLAQLVGDLAEAELPDGYRLLFIRAMAEFAVRNYAESSRLFREVQDQTRQLSRRLHTSYVVAGPDGKPTVFTGRVRSINGRYGHVWVNELSTLVRFEPRLFSASGIFARDQNLGAFHIGFKLGSGPVAEPRKMFRESHRS